MALRTIRERALQTIAYEAGAFIIATPLYALIAGHGAAHSSLLVIAVAIACMIWAPLHHTLWDWLEWRLKRRLASDRPQGLRLVHAVSHEVSSIIITTPVIMLVGGLGFWQALLVDIVLTLLYTLYAYVFHIAYDWLRPVQPEAGEDVAQASSSFELPRTDPRLFEQKPAAKRRRVRRPARWAPRILPHAGLALIAASRGATGLTGA